MNAIVYRLRGANGDLLYIGRSSNIGFRLSDHAMHTPWFKMVANIEVTHYETLAEATDAERSAIQLERPLFNIEHASDADAEMARGRVSAICAQRGVTYPFSPRRRPPIDAVNPTSAAPPVGRGEFSKVSVGSGSPHPPANRPDGLVS